jgi:hypothetical protein
MSKILIISGLIAMSLGFVRIAHAKGIDVTPALLTVEKALNI